MSKVFLTVVGAAYVALALWCAVSPRSTANAIGLELKPGAGESEYFTVYGGLQFGLGLIFLWPLLDANLTGTVLKGCAVLHGSLVLFRTISLLRYSGVPAMTLGFAASEWVIFLAAVGLWWRGR